MAKTLPFEAPEGAVVDIRHGRPVAVRFSTATEEDEALRRKAALFDWSTQGLVLIEGRDRVEFLHRILTQDIKSLAAGRAAQAALVTAGGKLVADGLVVASADRHLLLVDRLRAPVVAEALERYVFSEDVRVSDASAACAALAILGPAAGDALAAAIGHRFAIEPLRHAETAIDGAPALAIGWGPAAQGLTLLVPAEARLAVWRRLRDAGRGVGLRPVGWDAVNIARLEAGVPWFGLDFDDTHLLPETGLEAVAVSGSKGCYIGQEIIARMETYGSASRKLMTLRAGSSTVPDRGDPIMDGEEAIGAVTSAGWSPGFGVVVGLGFVKRPFYEPGRQVEILHAGSRLRATLGPTAYSPR